jgi:NTP pyrophosphatase (non-canonical NTP hydrolase)
MRTFSEFNEYDRLALRTAHHPTGGEEALLYVGCALAGEAGEVANEIKKVSRDDKGVLSEDRRTKIIAEIGDCLWYLNSLANEIGTTLQWCAMVNIDKLEKRHADKLVATTGYSPAPEHSVVPVAGSSVRV